MALLNVYDDFARLPIGTEFYVHNGNWHGRMVLDEDFDLAVDVFEDYLSMRRPHGKPVKVNRDTQYHLNVSVLEVPEQNIENEYITKEYFDYLVCYVATTWRKLKKYGTYITGMD